VAVVTGGAQGLGLGIARRLLDDGRRLAIVDAQQGLKPEVERDLRQRGEVVFYSADVTDQPRMREIEQEVTGRWGRVDELVSNAGIFPRCETAELPLEEWERVLRVNLTGGFICAQAFSRTMRQNRGGAIVTISSGRAFMGAVNGAAYASSKAGIIGLTRSLAMEWAPYGIRVNCVVPGIADTAQPREELNEEQMQAAGRRVPLGHLGQPEDVAAAVAFLLSDDASYITGQTLGVNGGAVLI
jgi:NAD(P)-dependent dehydrogenase (short-subunit alcohol dehydrogenase family)